MLAADNLYFAFSVCAVSSVEPSADFLGIDPPRLGVFARLRPQTSIA